MQKMLYIFPDTNLFVQCRPLEELDWKALCGDSSITLVLARPVVTEMDHQKGRPGRVGERARKVNTLIRPLLETATIAVKTGEDGPIITIVPGDGYKPLAGLSEELDYSLVDDRLVGTVAAYQAAHADRNVALLSHDTGPLMSAKRLGVPFLRVPDDWILKPENDEEQKRVRKLETELARYKKAEPACTIVCKGSPWNFEVRRYAPLDEDQITELMARLEKRYPMATDFGSAESEARRPEKIGIASKLLGRGVFKPATKEEITTYRDQKYPEWLASCEAHFRSLHLELDKWESFPLIELELCNEGARPADDVLVRFEVNGGRFGMSALDDDEDKKEERQHSRQLPLRPVPPNGAWLRERTSLMGSLVATGRTQVGSDVFVTTGPLHSVSMRDPNTFHWKGGRSKHPKSIVELDCQQWRHHGGRQGFAFHLMFKKEYALIKGAVTTTIHAANLTNPVVHTQPISISIEEADIWADAVDLIDNCAVRRTLANL